MANFRTRNSSSQGICYFSGWIHIKTSDVPEYRTFFGQLKEREIYLVNETKGMKVAYNQVDERVPLEFIQTIEKDLTKRAMGKQVPFPTIVITYRPNTKLNQVRIRSQQAEDQEKWYSYLQAVAQLKMPQDTSKLLPGQIRELEDIITNQSQVIDAMYMEVEPEPLFPPRHSSSSGTSISPTRGGFPSQPNATGFEFPAKAPPILSVPKFSPSPNTKPPQLPNSPKPMNSSLLFQLKQKQQEVGQRDNPPVEQGRPRNNISHNTSNVIKQLSQSPIVQRGKPKFSSNQSHPVKKKQTPPPANPSHGNHSNWIQPRTTTHPSWLFITNELGREQAEDLLKKNCNIGNMIVRKRPLKTPDDVWTHAVSIKVIDMDSYKHYRVKQVTQKNKKQFIINLGETPHPPLYSFEDVVAHFVSQNENQYKPLNGDISNENEYEESIAGHERESRASLQNGKPVIDRSTKMTSAVEPAYQNQGNQVGYCSMRGNDHRKGPIAPAVSRVIKKYGQSSFESKRNANISND